MAIFEGIAFARNQGAPGTVIAMESRVIGFAVAITLMLVIPYLAGCRSYGCSEFSFVYETFTNAFCVTRRRDPRDVTHAPGRG